MDHFFNRACFHIYDNKLLVTAVHVKVSKEGENQHMAVEFFY